MQTYPKRKADEISVNRKDSIKKNKERKENLKQRKEERIQLTKIWVKYYAIGFPSFEFSKHV